MSKFYIFDNKAVINSQFSLINLSDHVFSELAPILGNRALIGVPFFHVYALMGAWIYLAHGGTVVIPSTIKADLIADLVEKESISDIWTVAVIYQAIIDDELLAEKVAPNARFCAVA